MNEEALIEAGKKAYDQGDLALAISHYKQALDINPDSYKAVNKLGSALHAQSEFKAAAEVYNNAISRLENQNIVGEVRGNLHLALGEVYVKLNRLEDAQEQFARASQSGAEEYLLRENRGNGYLALEKFDEALVDFEAYIQLDPDSPDGYLGKARAYQGKQQYDLAAEALRIAQTLGPDDHWVEVALGSLSISKSDYRNALKHYQRASQLDPHSLAVKYNIGYAYLHLDEYEFAKQAFLDVLEQRPNDAKSMAGLAFAENGLGNTQQAIASFKSAILVEPFHQPYYDALYRAQLNSGEWWRAFRTSLRIKKLFNSRKH